MKFPQVLWNLSIRRDSQIKEGDRERKVSNDSYDVVLLLMIWDERRYDGNREIHDTKHDTYDHFSSMKGMVANLIQTEKRIYAIIHAIEETKDSKYHKEEED